MFLIGRNDLAQTELMVIVVVIGLIAAIAIPKFSASRERAYYRAMRSDLEALASLQKAYHADHGSYAMSLDEVGLTPSDGVTIVFGESSGNGWTASATHAGLGDESSCAHSGGTAIADSSTTAATTSGVTCNQR